MRISDWSSDVCSSDLHFVITLQQMRAARALLGLDQRQLAELAGLSLPTIQRMESSDGQEIGRASCRERVCQYVSISVVAVSLKKKDKRISKQVSRSSRYNPIEIKYTRNKHDEK